MGKPVLLRFASDFAKAYKQVPADRIHCWLVGHCAVVTDIRQTNSSEANLFGGESLRWQIVPSEPRSWMPRPGSVGRGCRISLRGRRSGRRWYIPDKMSSICRLLLRIQISSSPRVTPQVPRITRMLVDIMEKGSLAPGLAGKLWGSTGIRDSTHVWPFCKSHVARFQFPSTRSMPSQAQSSTSCICEFVAAGAFQSPGPLCAANRHRDIFEVDPRPFPGIRP